ncbi:LysR family transcriptional regulator [Paraburkholderia sediminicola]|uniref:LysR family transcriptional regulator n=1 Tax=Paraburkholderia sediminicola TaxID=458836 RepID=UPI0038BACCEE
MMNPAHIDLFRAVMRHGGMTRAAEALGIGQPHVSRAIAQLEADLGFPLFVRGHGSALPTIEAEAFSREVERTYAGLDQLRQAGRQIREIGTGLLRVACQPSLASRFVPRAIRQLGLASPGVRVSLHVPGPDTIWSLASTGQCDIGLVRPRSGYAGVERESFLTVDAVCALPRRHALARKRTIAVSDLVGVPLISGAPGVFQQAIEASFARAGIEPRFVLMAQYTAARCGLVAEGLGLAIVDPLPARELIGLPIVLRPFQPRLPIETMLIRPGGRPPDSLTARFIDLLKTEREAVTSTSVDYR